jgi:hypothetical protein
MKIKSYSSMNIQSTTAMTRSNPASEAYWKSVVLCIARTDGSAKIHHLDGRVERIGTDGQPVRGKSKATNTVT